MPQPEYFQRKFNDFICGLEVSADTSKPLFSREEPKFQTVFFLTTFTVKAKNRKSPQTFPVFEYKNNSAEHGQSETEAIQTIKSNQDADEPGTALIDDPFQRFLQAGAGFLRHVEELVLQSLIHQFMQALAKDV